jgi:hypothetical protein
VFARPAKKTFSQSCEPSQLSHETLPRQLPDQFSHLKAEQDAR